MRFGALRCEPKNSRRCGYDSGAGWHVAGDQGVRPYHRSIAYGDSPDNGGADAKYHILPNARIVLSNGFKIDIIL